MERVKIKFIGRTDELNKVFSLDEFTASLIFGRRRDCKSELIKRSINRFE